ncbi:MAG TPA: 50S ribosomal protein L30e [archaeon]|nr:50S ribosomal protein L30e [archaeon]
MLTDEIQSAIKSDKAIFGYRETIKFIKVDSPKFIVIAKNAPESMKKEIEHNAKIAGMDVEVFDGTSKELGVVCGKPFPIATLTIKA